MLQKRPGTPESQFFGPSARPRNGRMRRRTSSRPISAMAAY